MATSSFPLSAQQAEAPQEVTLYFTHAPTVQAFQEMATAIRTIADIREVDANEERKSLFLRGSVEQLEAATWLFNELDQPVDADAARFTQIHPFEASLVSGGVPENAVRAVTLAHAGNDQDFQEVVVLIRTISDIRRAYAYNNTKTVLLRGTQEQVEMADWLFRELDRPTEPVTDFNQRTEYRIPGTRDDVVRIFQITEVSGPLELNDLAKRIRDATEIRRMFAKSAANMLVMRGTPDQIARAERMLTSR